MAFIRSTGTKVTSADNVLAATTLVPGLPGTRVNGDLLLLLATCRTNAAAGLPATPSGWTLLANVSASGGRIVLFGKAVVGGETDPSVAYSGLTTGTTSVTPVCAQIAAVAGVDLSGGVASCVDVLGAASTQAASTTVAAGGAAITTTLPYALVFSISERNDDAGTWATKAASDGIVWAKVATTQTSSSGADMAVEWQWGVKPAAGAVAASSFATSGALSFASMGVMIAFKPTPVEAGAAAIAAISSLACAATVVAAPPVGVGAVVQSKVFNMPGTDANPHDIALDSPTTAGNCLVLVISAYEPSASPGWPSLYDPYNTWYIAADQWSWTVNSGVIQIQYAPNIAARSSYVLGVQVPATYYWHAVLMEVSGVKAPSPVETHAIRQSQSGTSIGSGSVTPPAAAFEVAGMTEDAGTTVSAVSAGWTEVVDDGAGQPLHVAVRSLGASAAGECFFTVSSTTGAGVILALEEAAAGGGVTEYGAAAIAASGGLASAAVRTRRALAAVAAASGLAAGGVRTRRGLAVVGSASSLSVQARRTRTAAAVVGGTSSVAASARVLRGGAAVVGATSTLVASGTRVPGAPGGPITPDQLSGLAIWLDASGLTAGALASWPNPGSGADAPMVGTPLPLVVAGGLNGRSIVRFAVSEGRLRMTGTGVDRYFTLAYVTRRISTGNGRVLSAAYPPPNFLVGYHTTNMDTGYDGAFFGSATASTPTWKLYSAYQSGGATTMYSDGVQLGSPGMGTDGLGNTLNLSGYSTGTEETCDCEVAELVVYDRVLTTTERQQVESYLREKWFVAPTTGPEYGAGVLAGAGALAAAAVRTRRAQTVVAGASTLAAQARRTRQAQVALGASSSLACAATVVKPVLEAGAAAVAATSSVTVSARRARTGAAQVVGASLASVAGARRRASSALLGGSSSWLAAGRVTGPQYGAARLDGAGRLVVTAVRGRIGSATTEVTAATGTSTVAGVPELGRNEVVPGGAAHTAALVGSAGSTSIRRIE